MQHACCADCPRHLEVFRRNGFTRDRAVQAGGRKFLLQRVAGRETLRASNGLDRPELPWRTILNERRHPASAGFHDTQERYSAHGNPLHAGTLQRCHPANAGFHYMQESPNAVIPAKAGIHVALASEPNGFPLSRE